MEARVRVYGASPATAEAPEWGYLLGRIFLDPNSGMTSREHEAGVRLSTDYARYYGLCALQHPNARALDLFRVHGRSGEGDPVATQKAIARYEELETLLRQRMNIYRIVKAVCVYELDDNAHGKRGVELLRIGLGMVADFYGIPEKELVKPIDGENKP